MSVFGKKHDEEKEEKETNQEEAAVTEKNQNSAVLDAATVRALKTALQTTEMFSTAVREALAASEDENVSDGELKDLLSRCKSYSLLLDKDFKIMRRRMR